MLSLGPSLTSPAVIGGAAGALNALRKGYVDQQLGMFIHLGLETFLNSDSSTGSIAANTFAPTGLDIDQWVTAAQALGARYACLTAKHHSGFCLWPSATTTYDVAATTWYGAGGYDIVAAFLTKFRAAGITPILYFSVWDKNFEAANPGYTQAQYRARLEAQLAELLTSYGSIPAVWLDGTEWHFGSAYPWSSGSQRNLFIKSLQPNCLVVDNSHTFTYADSDIIEWEVEVDVTQGNTMFGEKCLTMDAFWFWKSSGFTLKTPEYVLDRLYRSKARNATLLLNMPPSDVGTIPSEYTTVAARVAGPWWASPPVTGVRAAIWLDPSDLSSMKQERTGYAATTAAAVDSPVGSIRNKGHLGGWLTAAADANRPILRNSGSVYWLEFDGSDDRLLLSAQRTNSDVGVTSFVGFRRNSGANVTAAQASGAFPPSTDFQIFSNIIYVGGLTNLFASTAYTESGVDRVASSIARVSTPSLRINGVARALTAGAARAYGPGLDYVFAPGGNANGAHRLYQYMSCYDQLSAAQIAAVEAFIASKVGINF